MGDLNSFSASGGGGKFEIKFSKNSNARGVVRRGCLSFDLTGTEVFKRTIELSFASLFVLRVLPRVAVD